MIGKNVCKAFKTVKKINVFDSDLSKILQAQDD
jgi:hypothetical protein